MNKVAIINHFPPSVFPPSKGVAFANVRGMLFLIIGFGERESEIKADFGKSMFVYGIASHDWTTEESATAIRIRTVGGW